MSLRFRFISLLLVLNLCNFSRLVNVFAALSNDYQDLDVAVKEFYYYDDDPVDESFDAVKIDAAQDITAAGNVGNTNPEEKCAGIEAGLRKHAEEQVAAFDDASILNLRDMIAVPVDPPSGLHTNGIQITRITHDNVPENIEHDIEHKVYFVDKNLDTSESLANANSLVPNKQEILECVDDEMSNMQDGESGACNGVMEDLEKFSENYNKQGNRRETANADGDEHVSRDTSSLLGMPRCPDRLESVSSAVSRTQVTIDHVENLIRSVRQHSIDILKDMSELETDFLGAITSKEALCATTGNGGNGANSDSDTCGKSKSFSSNTYSGLFDKKAVTSNRNPSNKQRTLDPTSNNVDATLVGSAESSSTDSEKNDNSIGLNGDTLVVTNEWAVPVETLDLAGKELMRQAQAAVQSWKDQIEQCKLVLDAAVAHAQIAELQNALRDQALAHAPQPATEQDSPKAQLAPVAAVEPAAVTHGSGSHTDRTETSASDPAVAPAVAAPPSPNDSGFVGWPWNAKDKSKDGEGNNRQRKADDVGSSSKHKSKDEKKIVKKKTKKKRGKKKVKHKAQP